VWFLTANDALTGKITHLHNYMTTATYLTDIQQHNEVGWPCFIDSMSVTSFPHLMNPGDSVYIRVRIDQPTILSPSRPIIEDSLRYTTDLGTKHLTIKINSDLLDGIGDVTRIRALGNSYPNPFSSITSIPLEIPQRGHVTLEILDIRGSLIKTLVSKVLEPGTSTIQWDGTDANGNKLPGGIYLSRLISENFAETKRLIFIK